MRALRNRPPRNTGPIEVRDYGPNGRKLGTFADCYDGSPWELHRGELVEQVGSKDIHGILMALIAALFRTHARPGLTVMTDVYCDLSDAEGPSLRAPDVSLVQGLGKGKDDFYRGNPIIAVEIRGTQSKRYLEEKVKLYLEHDWPCTWIVHADREELEIMRPGLASVTYRPGAQVPLGEHLGKYGLSAVPVTALFDEDEFARYCDGWAEAQGQAQGQAQALLTLLKARRLLVSDDLHRRIVTCGDAAQLEAWVVAAATASSVEEVFA
jgi:Uma2 family endonuclease